MDIQRADSSPSRWQAVVRRAANDGLQRIDRTLGVLRTATRTGPSSRDPLSHKILHTIGVLQRHPSSWEIPDFVAKLPWGAGVLEAPPASPPPGIRGMWLQDSVVHPRGWPTIIRMPIRETAEHVAHNSMRYLGQMSRLTPIAALKALRGPRVVDFTDRDLAQMLTQTSLGQFVGLRLNDKDRRVFAPFLKESGNWAKADYSGVLTTNTHDGVYTAAPVTLLRRLPNLEYEVVAIAIGDRVWSPRDGANWKLARLFMMQAANFQMTMIMHPRLHFPHDAVNVVTKQVLDPDHIVRRLISAHSRFTLGLNHSVVNHARSIIHGCQREIYTSLPYDWKGSLHSFELGRLGREGCETYKSYRWGDQLIGEHTPYGVYRGAWFEVIHQFVRGVLAGAPRDDQAIASWAHHIAKWVPGFPCGEKIREAGVLAHAVALHVATVSVFHTADHHSYSAIPIECMPMRLRTKPPSGERTELSLDALVLPEDYFRHFMSHAMFFKPVIISPLSKVRYRFAQPHAKEAARRFADARKALDKRFRGSPFPQSADIADSVQY